MTYFYQISGIKIRIELPFEMTVSKESQEFLKSDSDVDFIFKLIPVPCLSMPKHSGTWMVNACYYVEDSGYSVYHCPVRGDIPYAHVLWQRQTPKLLLCEYVTGQEQMLCHSRDILELLGLESVMLQHDALLLHASFVRWKGKGILFTAPSGTGKSTQANLWEQYSGAEILNGDRAALRKRDDSWYAWGLPYAGSSGIYRNESSPIAALVVLRQAKENRIHRISAGEAMRYIYPELTIHRWDAAYVSRAIDLFLELADQVPVFLLECLPNRGAVQLLEDQLTERGGRL